MRYLSPLIQTVAFTLCMILFVPSGHGTESGRRSLGAVRTPAPPVLDGTMEDPLWQRAGVAGGFHQYEPHNDRPATHDTRVRVLYDDQALYIAAKMKDPTPDSILMELGLRNSGNDLNADRFFVDINPFDDGITGFRFQVSASGVQTDANMSGGGRHGDLNWDAVWVSNTSVFDGGWIVEMMIPYSALRFPGGEVQQWGINFWREVRRTRETSSWNRVDRRVGDELAFLGELTGIDGVRPPLRLAFYPYLSNYVEKNGFDRGWANSLNGGMDVKYGISPSFTMDMTLVPDFGQVQSDARVLNLTPFEIRYDENRQFFTEGVELFQRADLFYSRRIGDTPRNHGRAVQELGEDEMVIENPLETRLINATKVSGRTAGGLGIGFFNAMTAASRATLKDTLTGQTRQVTTQPFTNYNLVVLDQSLRNNSYVSLVNTMVAGSGGGYASNVTGTEFRLLDASNMFRVRGSGAVSQQYLSGGDNTRGYKYDLQIGKVGGTWRYYYTRDVISDAYDQNDMGFLRRNNRIDDAITVSHHVFDPFWRFWMLTNSFTVTHSRLYEPGKFTGLQLGHHLMVLFDTRFHISLRTNFMPRGERDYYEPRVPGRFYRTDDVLSVHMSYSSDYRKRLFFDGSFSYNTRKSVKRTQGAGLMIRPTFRVSDRLNMSYGFEYQKQNDDLGFVHFDPPEQTVYFGLRQSPTAVNTVRGTYMFSNDVSLGLDLRHYWSRVEYDGLYYVLDDDGRLLPADNGPQAPDINYNAFTVDLLFTWHFAPGSQLSFAWKNVIDHREEEVLQGYWSNFRDMLGHPQINSFSLRLLYYLDYQSVKNLRQRLIN